MKQRKQIDIDRIAAFKHQLNRISKNIPGSMEIRRLYSTLSDDAIELLMSFAVTTAGLALDVAKVPLLVAAMRIQQKEKMLDFLRANIAIQIDLYALPRVYKDIFIKFLTVGYQKEDKEKIVRKLVLYYIRTDREAEEYKWVDFEYIDGLMKKTIQDDTAGVNDAHRDYFMRLYANGHKAIRRILELSNAITAGHRSHNLIRNLAKDDRYANVPEQPIEKFQVQKDKWLFKRLALMFDIGMQPITRRDLDEMIRNERFQNG